MSSNFINNTFLGLELAQIQSSKNCKNQFLAFSADFFKILSSKLNALSKCSDYVQKQLLYYIGFIYRRAYQKNK